MHEEQASNTNTVLIVIVLLILVAFGVWWFTKNRQPAYQPEEPGINVDVTLPSGTDTTGGTDTSGGTGGGDTGGGGTGGGIYGQ